MPFTRNSRISFSFLPNKSDFFSLLNSDLWLLHEKEYLYGMKLILSAILALPLAALAQTVVLSEDFQQGFPSSWTLYNDTNEVHSSISGFTEAWIALPDPENSLDTVAASTSYFTTPADANRWMVSPAITLGAFGNFLSWKAKSHDPSFPDNYRVMISTSPDPATFTDTLADIFAENFLWEDREISLTGFDNQTVYIAFILTTYDGFKLYLDDIVVRKDDPLAVHKEEKAAFRVFPNPCSGQVMIAGESEIETVEICDASGKIVLKEKSALINTAALADGVYLLHIRTASGTAVQRLLVRH